MVPRIIEPSCAVLRQRLESDLYAYRPKVAMQRRDHRPVISLQCVADHRGTSKPEISSILLRYPARWRSKRPGSSGLLTQTIGYPTPLESAFFWPSLISRAHPNNASIFRARSTGDA